MNAQVVLPIILVIFMDVLRHSYPTPLEIPVYLHNLPSLFKFPVALCEGSTDIFWNCMTFVCMYINEKWHAKNVFSS